MPKRTTGAHIDIDHDILNQEVNTTSQTGHLPGNQHTGFAGNDGEVSTTQGSANVPEEPKTTGVERDTNVTFYETGNEGPSKDDILSQEEAQARNEAIRRRQESHGDNQASMNKHRASEYHSAQMAEKHGWTGGQMMDENTRTQFLQAQLNADVYARDAYVEAEFDSQLAIAREYASLKEKELAQEAYHRAEQNALARFELSGHYMSPEATDMLNQYQMAVKDTSDPERAARIKENVEQYFLDLGYSDQVVGEDGEIMEVANPAVINALSKFNNSVQQQQLELDHYLSRYAQAMAQYELKDREGAEMVETPDGHLYVRYDGVQNPDNPEKVWDGTGRKWVTEDEYTEIVANRKDEDEEESKEDGYQPPEAIKDETDRKEILDKYMKIGYDSDAEGLKKYQDSLSSALSNDGNSSDRDVYSMLTGRGKMHNRYTDGQMESMFRGIKEYHPDISELNFEDISVSATGTDFSLTLKGPGILSDEQIKYLRSKGFEEIDNGDWRVRGVKKDFFMDLGREALKTFPKYD